MRKPTYNASSRFLLGQNRTVVIATASQPQRSLRRYKKPHEYTGCIKNVPNEKIASTSDIPQHLGYFLLGVFWYTYRTKNFSQVNSCHQGGASCRLILKWLCAQKSQPENGIFLYMRSRYIAMTLVSLSVCSLSQSVFATYDFLANQCLSRTIFLANQQR